MKNATKYLTEAQVRKLMDAAKGRARSKVNGHRDATMIYLAWAHGLRVAELVGLRWSQVDLAAGRVAVTRVKNGSPSSQPLFGDGLRMLRQVQRDWPEHGGFVFVSERGSPFTTQAIRKMLALAGEEAGLPAEICHPHALRHGCGHYLAENGIDTRRIQDWLGHRDINHTRHYTDLSEKGKFDGIARLHK